MAKPNKETNSSAEPLTEEQVWQQLREIREQMQLIIDKHPENTPSNWPPQWQI